jgi:hypothetical protein
MTITCNELKDSDEVFYEGKEIKWFEFKKTFPKWVFTASNQKMNLVKSKNVKIWNYIGEQICNYYLKEKKVNINFVKATNKHVPKIHYILLLDRSGSMDGEKWINLMDAVSAFLKELDDNIMLKKNSRVSIIGYDHFS